MVITLPFSKEIKALISMEEFNFGRAGINGRLKFILDAILIYHGPYYQR